MLARRFREAVAEIEITAAELAAEVRRPARLQAAENAWRGLVGRNSQLTSEIRALIEQRRNPDDPNQNRRIAALCAERDGLAIGSALAAVIEARPQYIEALEQALKPLRSTAARRALAALEDLRGAIRTLDDIQRTLRRAGAGAGQIPLSYLVQTPLQQLERRLRDGH
jgi:hypothetical protein